MGTNARMYEMWNSGETGLREGSQQKPVRRKCRFFTRLGRPAEAAKRVEELRLDNSLERRARRHQANYIRELHLDF